MLLVPLLSRAGPGASPDNCFVLSQLLKEAVESQRMCELMKQQETHLKQQVSSLLSLFCLGISLPPSLNNPKFFNLESRGAGSLLALVL